jgi:hypothetical protein
LLDVGAGVKRRAVQRGGTVYTPRSILRLFKKHGHVNSLNSRASEICYNIILQEKVMCFNLKPKEILIQGIQCTPSRVNVFETDIMLPCLSELNLTAALPC